MQTRYILTVLSGPILISTDSLGNSTRSTISMGLRGGVDGVDQSEFEEWFVEECLVCSSRCMHCLLSTFITKLTHGLKFKFPRLVTYRILCEGLEKDGGIMDAIGCFQQMAGELTEETIMQGQQAEWVLSE